MMTFRIRFDLQWFPHMQDIEAKTIDEAVTKLRSSFNSTSIKSIEIITPGTPSQASQDNKNTYVWIGSPSSGAWEKKQKEMICQYR